MCNGMCLPGRSNVYGNVLLQVDCPQHFLLLILIFLNVIIIRAT